MRGTPLTGISSEIHRQAETENSRGRVHARFGSDVLVDSHDNRLVRCALRRRSDDVVCGDWVVWRAVTADSGIVVGREPRRTLLSRYTPAHKQKAMAANVDQLAIVFAVKPAPLPALVDRYLVAAELSDIRPLLVLNKCDLGTHVPDGVELLNHYRSLGYAAIISSAATGQGLEALRSTLAGSSTVISGQSGVGKSSLIDALVPGARIRIGQLGPQSHGRHTTSNSRFYPLTEGGGVIDSPGVRDFGIPPLNAQRLAAAFVEFRPWLAQCRFHNCRHRTEPGCAVRQAISAGEISERRWRTYVALLDEHSA